jgi:16S rRNA (guanine966-N2)-methyltransferase
MPVGRALVDIVIGELDIPAIEAVATAVRHDVASLKSFIGGITDEATLAAAIDANDGLWDRHEGDRSSDGPDCVMRVVAGTARGRRLAVPEGDHTRPTADRVREAVFNSLYSLGAIEDAKVIDVFAGSGALGIEALSRGAAHCTFVDNDRRALVVLNDNIDTVGFRDRARVVSSDGASVLARNPDVDLVLLDPPYAFDEWDSLLAVISNAIVMIESRRGVEVPAGWETHRVRKYGSTVVTLASAPDLETSAT